MLYITLITELNCWSVDLNCCIHWFYAAAWTCNSKVLCKIHHLSVCEMRRRASFSFLRSCCFRCSCFSAGPFVSACRTCTLGKISGKKDFIQCFCRVSCLLSLIFFLLKCPKMINQNVNIEMWRANSNSYPNSMLFKTLESNINMWWHWLLKIWRRLRKYI